MDTRRINGGDAPLSVRQVSAMLGCHQATVRSLIRDKRLDAFRLGEGGSWRVHRETVEKFIRANSNAPQG